MALPRVTFIENLKVLDQSGSLSIDINVIDPIAALEIRLQARNGTTNNQANHLHDLFTTIELVDGSDVLYSLAMVKGQALNFYETGRIPIMQLTEWANDYNRETVTLYFGRNLFDTEYAFLPTRFRNPQLKLTWNLDAVRDSDVTGHLNASGRLSIIAHILPAASGARGFLTAKDIYSFTTAGSGDEQVELPYDNPYRFLIIRSYEAGNDYNENITRLKLSIDHDSFIPFDLETIHFLELVRLWFGPTGLDTLLDRADGDAVRIHVNQIEGITVKAKDSNTVVYDTWSYSSTVNLAIKDTGTGGTHSGDINIRLREDGVVFHNTLCFPFGNPQDPKTWFDPKPYRSIRLALTQVQSGAAASVIVQQLRRY